MAHGHKSDEKVVYVGDSRVRKNTNKMLPRDYSAYPGKSEAFIPNFLLKEWMVAAVVAVGFLVLTMSEAAPLGYPADPLNGKFIPMPDWYFLFAYQLLKYEYMSQSFVLFGLVLPGLGFGGLLLAPFLDTGKERRFYKRPIASALMLISLVGLVHLTYVSWTHYTHELEAQGIVPEHIEREELMKEGAELPKSNGGEEEAAAIPIVGEDEDGYQIYQKATCVQCHATGLEGMPPAVPALLGVGDKYSKEQIMEIIKNGVGDKMGPQVDANLAQGLTEEDLDKLAEWLSKQKAGETAAE